MRQDFLVFGRPAMSQDAWKRFSDAGYRHYEVTAPGFKYNMTDLQGLPVVRPAPVEGDTIHARHLYTTLVDDRLGKSRDRVLDEPIALRIGTGVHYTALHLHRYYRER